MKKRIFKFALPVVALFVGALPAFALDGVIIANENVPATSLTAAALKDIYTGKTMYWEGGQAITIVFVVEKTDAALKDVCSMDSSGFKTFWQRLVFSGRGQQPKKTDDAAAAVDLVASTKGAIAIVPADAATKGAKKIEVK